MGHVRNHLTAQNDPLIFKMIKLSTIGIKKP